MSTIIVQIERFFKVCFALLFVAKNDGKTKNNTAIKNIAEINNLATKSTKFDMRIYCLIIIKSQNRDCLI